ncbi:hypothetical protein [Amphritea sp. HPY]|uniref:hypothetical protein n=1 Tax=Amphritea sp. HPY TaxID=3421652 RepID=UPI003D7ED498
MNKIKLGLISFAAFIASSLALSEPPSHANKKQETLSPAALINSSGKAVAVVVDVRELISEVSEEGIVLAMSSTGYLFEITPLGTFSSKDLLYMTSDCSDIPRYVRLSTSWYESFRQSDATPRQLFQYPPAIVNGEVTDLFYIPINPVEVNGSFYSLAPNGSCGNFGGPAVEAMPNDPVITGVPNGGFSAPLSIGLPTE